jgi:hypothetical protein
LRELLTGAKTELRVAQAVLRQIFPEKIVVLPEDRGDCYNIRMTIRARLDRFFTPPLSVMDYSGTLLRTSMEADHSTPD